MHVLKDEDFYYFDSPSKSMRENERRGSRLIDRSASEDGAVAAALCSARGVDVDARVANGWSALHLAVRNGRVAVAQALLLGGADPNARARCNGFTPLHECVVHWEGSRCSCGGGASAASSSSSSSSSSSIDPPDCCSRPILRALFAARGIDLAARDRRGWTALRWAREKGEDEVVELLLRRGAAE
jgi:ankyrin repeat protein